MEKIVNLVHGHFVGEKLNIKQFSSLCILPYQDHRPLRLN